MDRLTHLSVPLGSPPGYLAGTSNPTWPTQTLSWLTMFFRVFLMFPVSVVLSPTTWLLSHSEGHPVAPAHLCDLSASRLGLGSLAHPQQCGEGCCLAQPISRALGVLWDRGRWIHLCTPASSRVWCGNLLRKV